MLDRVRGKFQISDTGKLPVPGQCLEFCNFIGIIIELGADLENVRKYTAVLLDGLSFDDILN